MSTLQGPKTKTETRTPTGVYTDHNRNTAIMVRQSDRGLWYLTMKRGWIELVHVSDEKFLHSFPLAMRAYPIRRALRIYESSGLRCDEDAQKVMHKLLGAMNAK